MPVYLCPACDQVYFADVNEPELEGCPKSGGTLRPLDEAEAPQRARRPEGESPPQ